MQCVLRFLTFGNFGQDSFNRRTPNENLRVLVVILKVLLDSRNQCLHVGESPTSDSLVGDFAKPAFDHVQP